MAATNIRFILQMVEERARDENLEPKVADGKGCVRDQLDVLQLGDIAVIKGDAVPGGEEFPQFQVCPVLYLHVVEYGLHIQLDS